MNKLFFFSLTLVVFSCESVPSREHIDLVLDRLHLYASEANGEAYFDLFADEAVFAGNPKQASAIKGLITENTRQLRKLYQDAITVPNF